MYNLHKITYFKPNHIFLQKYRAKSDKITSKFKSFLNIFFTALLLIKRPLLFKYLLGFLNPNFGGNEMGPKLCG